MRFLGTYPVFFLVLLCACRTAPPQDASFSLSWTNNLLSLSSPSLPGGKLDIWYLEAFCRSGAHNQDWRKTILPHLTRLVHISDDGKQLRFQTAVATNIIVDHDVIAERDSVQFVYHFQNTGTDFVDIQWFQPACIRVAGFTGCNQATYTGKSFVFTDRGQTFLDHTSRTTNALYLGGQVYLPQQTRNEDANPRPICRDRVINGLIGCVSADGKQILATASSTTHELFEGVYVCLHSDPYVGGLTPGESKIIVSRLYLLPNDRSILLRRYHRDFVGKR
jgi:hypothetical protein